MPRATSGGGRAGSAAGMHMPGPGRLLLLSLTAAAAHPAASHPAVPHPAVPHPAVPHPAASKSAEKLHPQPGLPSAANRKAPPSVTAAAAPAAAAAEGARALLLPDEEGHRLSLQNGTLAWLRSLPGPLAVVTAIGQYRSGKSYLLNQLMQTPCDQGFGVGHRRETQTKGVWAYATTISNGSGTTRVYLDTEGERSALFSSK